MSLLVTLVVGGMVLLVVGFVLVFVFSTVWDALNAPRGQG